MNFNQVQVGNSTDCPPFTTTSASGYDNFSEMENYDYGWVCPRCGSINAPWVRQCNCSENNWTITCGIDQNNGIYT